MAALVKRTAFRLPYVKYSTGANEATRTVYRALGKPNRRPPEGRSDYGLCNDKTQNGTTSLSGATALFGVQRSFLPYLFCQDRKDMARGAADAASQIAPRLRLKKSSPFLGLLLRVKLSTCGCGLFTNFLFTTAQQMFHKIACGQI